MTIVFTNIGRNKGNKTIEIPDAEVCTQDMKERRIADGARELLASREITAEEVKKNKFKIFAGFQFVGEAEII